MFNVYDKTTHPAPPGKYFCDKREDQPSTIPAKRFSTIEYVLRVANAEVLQSTVPLNDRGKTAFLALALNYGWYHKTEFGSFDISDATDRQCMGEYPAHSAKLIALLQDVLDERVVDGSGDLLQTSYRSGHPPAVCNPRDYPAGTASQWDISVLDKDEPDQNGQNCFLNDWRDIVTHFYPSGTSVVPGQKPGKTFTSVKTLPRGKVRLGFFSTDSQNTSHTSDKATGWWYHVEVKDNGGSWHPYTTTHYVDSDRDVRKYVDVDPPAKCTRFFRVWASNPVDKDHGGPKSMFNRGKCVRKVDDD